MGFYQVIISGEHDTDVWLINHYGLSEKIIDRMKKEMNIYPFWCTPGGRDSFSYCNYRDHWGNPIEEALCDISDIGIQMTCFGEKINTLEIDGIFVYSYQYEV